MTFLKKLSIIVTLGLGISFIAQAYDKAQEDKDITLILNFAQELRQQNSTKAQNVATWLEKKAMDPYYDITSCNHLVTIITIDDLTIQSKLATLAERMSQETRNNRYQKLNNCVATVCSGILFTGFSALMIWAFIESVRNPAPIIVTRRQPAVSVTWTTRYPVMSYNYY